MSEQLYTLHVDQWPAAVDATVKIVEVCAGNPNIVTVEGVEPRYPFVAGGKGLPVLSSDVEWYPRKVVYLSRLTAIAPADGEQGDRIAALQAELAECNQMGRILEIEAALKGYGVELVDENALADKYADGRMMSRNLSDTY